MKNILILHNPVNDTSKEDELDVLEQAELIENALTELGHNSQRAAFNLNSNNLSLTIQDQSIDMVFNLVETINESGKFSFVAPALLELCGIPFSGSGAEAVLLTTDKVLCKTLLRFHHINTPDWTKVLEDLNPEKYYIVKPVNEDGSVGIADDIIIQGKKIKDISKGFFAEEYIHGREFNISVIGGKSGYVVMPPAEMCFSEEFYETKPRILGYKAKWDESSPEYLNTTRSFQFEDTDNELISKLKEISGKCWEIFGLNGYARVDIRVGGDNIPQVIEINANPCLAPESGFIAACEKFGLTKTEIINRIIKAS